MADKKISALPASTTPLAGTEVLPIVQSGATTQVSVANLTAGRAISATSVTASTGNFIVGTSGQGIDFSATPGTGTSELLADYEEGTWTPALVGTGTLTTVTYAGVYTKIGRVVNCVASIDVQDWGTFTALSYISGLPFTSSATFPTPPILLKEIYATGLMGSGQVAASSTQIVDAAYYNNVTILSVGTSRRTYVISLSYFV
jgi:hypothetical protein